ncbi:MAG: hypothetical protein KDA24_02970 [Deltaproteobacteria bacterium]|nr:hypothetical protein [Deltaproteobacteria bacterium]
MDEPIVVETPVVLKGPKFRKGKRLRKALRRLRQGEGRLAREMAEAIAHVDQHMEPDPNRVFVPVVLVVKKRARPTRHFGWPFRGDWR